MRHGRRFLAKSHALLRRGFQEKDLDRELTSHLRLLADEYERRGMNPEDARQAAHRTFGSIAVAKEMSREAWSLVWLEQSWKDLCQGMRSLSSHPGFTLVAVLTLALGIGINVTFFTAFNALALKPLPVADPDRVVRLERWFERGSFGDIQYAFSFSEFEYCQAHNDTFAGLVAASWPIHVVAEIRSDASLPSINVRDLQGELVSANYFDQMGVAAQIGRTFLANDPPSIVLSNSFWREQFSGDPLVLGKVIVLNGTATTIVGVAAESFSGTSVALQTPGFWAPLSLQKQLAPGHDWRNEPQFMQLQLLARLKPKIPMRRAQAEADTLIRQFDATLRPQDRTKAVTLQHTSFLGNTEDPRFQAAVAALLAIVGLVLLVACANIANMLFARSVARRAEIGVRLALGANRARIVRHLLAESMLLALAGGALGFIFSIWAGKLLWVMVDALLRGPLTRGFVVTINLNPDLRVAAYTFAITILAGITFGVLPALRSSRADLTTVIKDQGSLFGSPLTRSRLRSVLLIVQVTVSMVLLITAGLLIRGMLRSETAATGFDTRNVFLVSAPFNTTPVKEAVMQRRLVDELQMLPNVSNATRGVAPLLGTWTPPIIVAAPQGTLRGRTLASYASDTYFDTLRIAMLRGRSFTRQEAANGAHVAVISEATGRLFWPDHDPLGQRFQLDLNFRGSLTEFEVIGIVKNVRFANLSRIDPAHVYLPTDSSMLGAILVRRQGDTKRAADSIRAAIRKIDPSALAGMSLVSLEDGPMRIHRSLAQLLAAVGAGLALLALILAAVGIYGVMAFLVNQRVKEIGIRMALGAGSGRVLRDVIGHGLLPVLVGLASGIAGAAVIFSLLHSTLSFPGSTDLLYGIPFYDPATFVGLSLLLVMITAIASAVPARKAVRIDPTDALRFQ
jgi:predicted permease